MSRMKVFLFFLVVVYTPQTFVSGKPTDPPDHTNFLDDKMSRKEPHNVQVQEVENAILNTLKSAENANDDDNDLNIVVKAAQLGKLVFNKCKDMIKKIDILVKEAEKNIADLNLELKSLQQQDKKFQEEYFSKFSEAKSELRKVRQSLRKLADKTIKETQGLEFLIRSLDKYENSKILEVALQKMSRLLDTSEKTLIEAKEKYNMAIQTFEILNSAIQNQNRYISQLLNKETAEFKEFEETVKIARMSAGGTLGAISVICIPLDITVTWGACGMGVATTGLVFGGAALSAEVILARNRAAWQKFKTITGNMIESGTAIDVAILDAVIGLTAEIDVMDKWRNSVDVVASNIENYPEEYLRQVKPIRDLFIKELGNLRQSAEEFLSLGKLFEENIDIENLSTEQP